MAREGSTPSVPAGMKAIAGVNGLIALVVAILGLTVLFVAVGKVADDAASNLLLDVTVPFVVSGTFLVLAGLLGFVARDQWRGLEAGRRVGIGLAGFAVLTSYLQMHVAAILVNGRTFQHGPAFLTAGLAVNLVYAIPTWIYLRSDRVALRTRDTAREPVPEPTGTPKGADEVLATEPVAGGRTLEPDVVPGRPLEGGTPPAGAVAKTTCSACATPIAVTTTDRPVIVECPTCGTQGRLDRAPDEWPAYR